MVFLHAAKGPGPLCRSRIVAIGCLVAVSMTLPAMGNDWDNSSGDAQWSNAVNWSGNLEPHSGTSALFPAGFPNGDTIIRLSTGENAVLVSFGDNYRLANPFTFPAVDTATLTLGSGVVHASAGVAASIQVRLFSNAGLNKIGTGSVSLSRTTTISGKVDADAGTLIFNSGGIVSSNEGLIAEAVGSVAVVTLDGASARWTITGTFFQGGLFWGSGNGTLSIMNGGRLENLFAQFGTAPGCVSTLNISGAGSIWNNALGVDTTPGATAAINITGGTVTIGENIGPGMTVTLDGGTLDMTGGSIGEGSVINLNLRSGTLRNVSEVNGTAGLVKTSTGTLILESTNTYTGPTTVLEGTLTLSGDASFASSPIISLGAGTTLDVTGVTGGLNFDGVGFALAPGQTLVGSGTINGPMGIPPGSTVTLGPSETLNLSHDAYIDGGELLVEGGQISAPNFRNNGMLAVASGMISTPGVLAAGNDGTLNGGSGSGTIDVDGGSVTSGAVLLGSAAGGSGNLSVRGSGTLSTGKLAANDVVVDGGTITILDQTGNPPDAVLDASMVGGFARDGAFHLYSGTVTTPKLKLGVTAGMTGFYEQTGGTLSAGDVFIGSPEGGIGELRWSGGSLTAQTLTMAGPATLGVSIANATLGSGYAQLAVSGHAALAGTLEIAFTDGYQPQPGTLFAVLSFGSRSGEFEQVTSTPLGDGRVLSVHYGENAVTLIVESDALGDCNGNGNTDILDYPDFHDCLAGPGNTLPTGCGCADIDADGDSDLLDVAALQRLIAD